MKSTNEGGKLKVCAPLSLYDYITDTQISIVIVIVAIANRMSSPTSKVEQMQDNSSRVT
jgi:hypothetical protein